MIYLDHNATTPVAPEVLEAMLPYFTEEWGNPSSSYRFGSKLKSVLEKSREQVADLLGAHPLEIVFTSCGTESNNTAIHAALKTNPKKRHIVTSQVEHSAVLNHCKALEKEGYRVTYLPVDQEGLLKLADLESALTDDTAVVSLMWANNETGVLFPVEEIGKLCRTHGILYHCDAVQAVGKIPISLKNLPIDYLSLTGHKLNAPKGIGALYVRRKAAYAPYIFGGHQEQERRGGTENVPLIVGLGAAAKLTQKTMPAYDSTVRPLRDNLENNILLSIPNSDLNGNKIHRLSNTTNITFAGIESEALLLLLDQAGICASSGSACLADSPDPSHVIAAMKPGNTARQIIRFSVGQKTTLDEIKSTLSSLKSCAEKLIGRK
jgi:cysteine desulfurase